MTKRDWFAEGFGQLVADIRHKLVEEAWFGREVTPSAQASTPSMAEALGWAQGPPEPSRSPEPTDHGMEIER